MRNFLVQNLSARHFLNIGLFEEHRMSKQKVKYCNLGSNASGSQVDGIHFLFVRVQFSSLNGLKNIMLFFCYNNKMITQKLVRKITKLADNKKRYLLDDSHYMPEVKFMYHVFSHKIHVFAMVKTGLLNQSELGP